MLENVGEDQAIERILFKWAVFAGIDHGKGFIQIDVARPHTIILNPIAGVVAIIAGLVLVATGRESTAV